MIASAPERVALIQAAHRQLRLLVRQIGALARQPLDDPQFYATFIQRIALALDATAGGIWQPGASGRLECVWPSNARKARESSAATAMARRERLVARAAAGKKGLIFQSPDAADHAGHVTIVVPIRHRERCAAVIEIHQPADTAAGTSRHWLKFLEHMAALAEKRLQARDAAAAPRKLAPWRKVSAFARAVHESLDLETTGYAIVNEVRQFLECDRVSLVALHQDRFRLLAVSGQDTIDRRADTVRQLENVARTAQSIELPIWCSREQALPGPLASLAEGAGIDSPWRQLGLYPLRKANAEKLSGVLIIEQISGNAAASELAARAELAAAHAAGALANAQDHADIFLLPLWQALAKLRHAGLGTRARRLLSYSLVACMAAIVLALVPIDFHVHGRGALQPVVQRDVFADLDGVVTAIHVEHGDRVQAGDVLAQLHNSDLEVQIAHVLGQCRAAQEQLAAIQRRRHDERLPREEQDRLAGQMLQLQEQLRGLNEQHALLLSKQQQLVIRSPIAGQVSTWNVERQLMLRPVTAGQVLLTIADAESPWELEVYFPESEIGHLTAARLQAAQPLAVDYLAVTAPTLQHAGALRHMDAHAQLYEEHGHAVRVLVDVDRQDVSGAPAGATVTARIDCGRRAMGYVWLHRLWAFIYDRVLFRLG